MSVSRGKFAISNIMALYPDSIGQWRDLLWLVMAIFASLEDAEGSAKRKQASQHLVWFPAGHSVQADELALLLQYLLDDYSKFSVHYKNLVEISL